MLHKKITQIIYKLLEYYVLADNMLFISKEANMEGEKDVVYICIKPVIDFVLSCILLMIILPFLLIIAVLIKVESKGPILYKQIRPGKDKKMFKIYKFRTMVQNADKYQQKGVEVNSDDRRITSLGRILRRYKIDELPQLINVIKGDMSLVGPRPTLPDYLDDYEEWEMERFSVRPGLTGLTQINGGIYLDYKERSIYDVYYAQHMSFFLDLCIILKTIKIIIFGEDKYIRKLDISKSKGRESGG